MIYVRRIKFLPGVVTWVTLGGILGMILGTYYLPIPNPYPKILFTFVATAFGIAVYIARWQLNLPPVLAKNRHPFCFLTEIPPQIDFLAPTGFQDFGWGLIIRRF